MKVLRRKLAGQTAYGVADQVFYSLSSGATTLILAGRMTQQAFGTMSLVLVAYTLSLGVMQSTIGVPYILGSAKSTQRDGGVVDAVDALVPHLALYTGGFIAVATATVLLGGSTLGSGLLVVAPFLPLMLCFEFCRGVFFTTQRAAISAKINFLWFALSVAAATILRARRHTIGANLGVVIWAAPGAIGGFLGLIILNVQPSLQIGSLFRWVRSRRELVVSLNVDFMLVFAQLQGPLVVVAIVLGTSAQAGLRGAQLMFFPATVLAAGLRNILLPRLVAAEAKDDLYMSYRSAKKALWIFSVPLIAVGVGTYYSVGRRILGDSAASAGRALWGQAIVGIMVVMALSPALTLQAMGQVRYVAKVRVLSVTISLVGLAVASALGGLVTGSLALALGTCVGLIRWELRCHKVLVRSSLVHVPHTAISAK